MDKTNGSKFVGSAHGLSKIDEDLAFVIGLNLDIDPIGVDVLHIDKPLFREHRSALFDINATKDITPNFDGIGGNKVRFLPNNP